MAKIQNKRGLESTIPSLNKAELGITTDTDRVFFGGKDGNVELAKKRELDNFNHGYWTPPTQPSTDTFKQTTYSAWIGKWDAYMSQFPNYITKEKFGTDHTNTYDMFFYALTPEQGYEKTIIIESCLHGNEKMGTYALYRFVYHLLNDWGKYPQLSYIRNKVRLILVPVANPYGFQNNQRRNGNPAIMGSDGLPGVDLNRNFNTDWDTYGNLSYPKGSSVFSEKESQAIRDLLVRFKDSIAFIDMHTITSNNAMYIAYMPRYSDANFSEIRKYIDYRYAKDKVDFNFVDGQQQVDFAMAKLPSSICHASYTHDMNSMTVEYRNQLYSPTWGDSLEMTKALEWFGNLIILNSKLKTKPKFEVLKDPTVRLVTFESADTSEEISITGISTYVSVDRFEDSFEVGSPGIVTVEGYVTIRLSGDATIDLQSWVYQKYSPEYSSTKTDSSDYIKFNTVVRTLPAGIHTIPILVAIRVYPTTNYLVRQSDGTEYKPKDVKVRLRARRKGPNGETTGVATLKIINYRVKTTYLPSDKGSCFVHVDASKYTVGGVPTTPSTVRKIYPPIVANDDSDESDV